MADVTEQELERWITVIREDMREGFGGVNRRLDALNGRTGTNEQRIAVLEDRGRRAAAVWGTGAGLAGTGVVAMIRYWLGK